MVAASVLSVPVRSTTAPRRRRAQWGQSSVEFSLVLFPLVLVLMGIFDLGRAVVYQHVLSNAAREGARYGVNLERSADQICARAMAAASVPNAGPLTRCGVSGDLSIAVEQRGTVASATDPLKVTVSFSYHPITPLIEQVAGKAFQLGATSSMYVEC